MKHLVMLSLLVLAGCSSPTMTTPTASNVIDLGHSNNDPRSLNTLSCKWRDNYGVPAWIWEHCPDGVPACTAAHVIPTIFAMSNLQKVYIVDTGTSPFYAVTDYPSPWCQR